MSGRATIIGWLLLALAAPAAALEPSQVVVLVNKNVPESVALGRYYCRQRQVPEATHLVELDLPTGDNISPEDYDRRLVAPLRQALAERKLTDTVRCLLTIRGVPFRVLERPWPPDDQMLMDWYATAGGRAAARLREDLRLLEQVGRPAPAKAASATDLYNRDLWFEPLPAATAPASDVGGTQQRFWAAARQKVLEIHRMGPGQPASVAQKQLLALAYDVFGLEGLREMLPMVAAPEGPTAEAVAQRLQGHVAQLNALASQPPTVKLLAELEGNFLAIKGAWGLHQQVSQQQSVQNISTSRAALDSELALLFWNEYRREGDMVNPLNWKVTAAQRAAAEKAGGGRVLMVSRLDGPETTQVMHMILDALAAERTGLKGTMYVDAGVGPNGLEEFNKHLQAAAEAVRRQTNVSVKLDTLPALFAPGECPDAALYVGWYSLETYVPAFEWVPGAVGYHVASWEARNLRDGKCKQWVPRMIAGRVGAVIGATDEPFLNAFPLPQEFFVILLTGKMTVAEAYWKTVPHVSWRMLLIGDPLYNPFKANPFAIELPEGVLEPVGAAAPG